MKVGFKGLVDRSNKVGLHIFIDLAHVSLDHIVHVSHIIYFKMVSLRLAPVASFLAIHLWILLMPIAVHCNEGKNLERITAAVEDRSAVP